MGLRKLRLMLFPLLVAGCMGPALQDDGSSAPAQYAKPPAEEGVLADMAAWAEAEHGAGRSALKLLDSSHDGLLWRLALIDSAQSSLSIQTYLWYPDASGRLILERAVRAAQRGVHVRLVIDDILTIGLDDFLVQLDAQPNVEVRLFNPWKKRSLVSRAGEALARLERLNTRMHNKLLVADGRAAVVGGRNIRDHYFGLNESYNFHDLDLLGFGPIGVQADRQFDHFWNSEWVVPAGRLSADYDPDTAERMWRNIQRNTREAPSLAAFPRDVIDWGERLRALQPELHGGRTVLVYDAASAAEIEQNLSMAMGEFFARAQKELLVTNAYIIPSQLGIDFVAGKTGDGVAVRILTNSLESHDVPAVNSHYREWRDDFVTAGADLFELRADAAIQDLVDVDPVQAKFVGLHTKAAVVDRRYAFVGSMNLDPRSVNINTEGGAFVDSPGLAGALAEVMERDMAPENAWQVHLTEEGKVYWENDQNKVTRQPARNSMQRVMDVIFKALPKDQY